VKTFNKLIVKIVELMPKSLVRVFSNRYIAGDSLKDGVEFVQKLNSQNILATMDVLGEAISTKDEAIEAKNEFIEVLEAIRKYQLNANISVKASQMGILLDEEFCFKQVSEIVEKAAADKNYVRLDMEDSTTTDKIINLLNRLRETHNNVGIVVQACLRRTLDDVKKLNVTGTNYRLCKGIYIEPEAISYRGKQEIRDNYLRILREMLTNGNYVGIATHDEYLITNAMKMITELGIAKDKYEFQMLCGVHEDLRDAINKQGHKIRIYVPFGEHWYQYSIRRLQENPQVAGHILKNLFTLR
jgi:proline dehydrogenase